MLIFLWGTRLPILCPGVQMRLYSMKTVTLISQVQYLFQEKSPYLSGPIKVNYLGSKWNFLKEMLFIFYLS